MKTRHREILNVDRLKHLDWTIDSRAAEHVIGPIPHVPVHTSEGSKMGVHCPAANGTNIVNRGETSRVCDNRVRSTLSLQAAGD